MTIDVPLLIGIQNACQIPEGKTDNKINWFRGASNPPDDAPSQ